MSSQEQLTVIGLGKLGASMTVALASRGFNVIGIDTNVASVNAINHARPPVQETDLDLYLSQYHSRISATADYSQGIANSTTSFIIVPTPSEANGNFSLSYVVEVCKELGKALRTIDTYHLVVLTSTVLPNASRTVLIPALEEASGKVCGIDFGFCYSPEFIALGSVIRDFLNPDFSLIGEFDHRSGDLLEDIYRRTFLNRAPAKRMSLENAELAKISLNCFVTMKISFANMISDICEQLPGGNIDVITDAIGTDKRIGHHYLKGGLGFAGPCFPRDNVALSFLIKQLGLSCDLPLSFALYNRQRVRDLTTKLKVWIPISGKVAILGLSYKPASHLTDESQGLLVAEALLSEGYHVCGYDPLASVQIPTSFTAEECIAEADLVVIANPDPEFIALAPEQFKCRAIIYDCWRCLSSLFLDNDRIQYIALGSDDAVRVEPIQAALHD